MQHQMSFQDLAKQGCISYLNKNKGTLKKWIFTKKQHQEEKAIIKLKYTLK